MLPFATESTPLNELAKFFRDLNNMPQISLELPNALRALTHENGASTPDAETDAAALRLSGEENNGTLLQQSPVDNGGGRGGIDGIDEEVDELTRQLEEFETSLNDYDSLVTSLCSHSEMDSNSNS